MQDDYAPEVGDPLTKRDRLLATLHENTWKLVTKFMQDPHEPRLSDRLFIVGELCCVEHRRNPVRSADLLERVIESYSAYTCYAKYLGPYVGLLRKYAFEVGRIAASPDDIMQAEEQGRGLLVSGSAPDGPSQLSGTTSSSSALEAV